MEDHHEGVESTAELEALISEDGVLFREFRGDGCMVVNDTTIFIIKDDENTDHFEFTELAAGHIHEIRVQPDTPETRMKSENAERVTGDTCTKIQFWVANHTVTFLSDARPHRAAAALANFRK